MNLGVDSGRTGPNLWGWGHKYMLKTENLVVDFSGLLDICFSPGFVAFFSFFLTDSC